MGSFTHSTGGERGMQERARAYRRKYVVRGATEEFSEDSVYKFGYQELVDSLRFGLFSRNLNRSDIECTADLLVYGARLTWRVRICKWETAGFQKKESEDMLELLKSHRITPELCRKDANRRYDSKELDGDFDRLKVSTDSNVTSVIKSVSGSRRESIRFSDRLLKTNKRGIYLLEKNCNVEKQHRVSTPMQNLCVTAEEILSALFLRRCGKEQERDLVVTERALYNFRRGMLGMQCQRRIPLEKITVIIASRTTPEFLLCARKEHRGDYRLQYAQKSLLIAMIARYRPRTHIPLCIVWSDDTEFEHVCIQEDDVAETRRTKGVKQMLMCPKKLREFALRSNTHLGIKLDGVTVKDVYEGKEAHRVGLRRGMIICSIGGSQMPPGASNEEIARVIKGMKKSRPSFTVKAYQLEPLGVSSSSSSTTTSSTSESATTTPTTTTSHIGDTMLPPQVAPARRHSIGSRESPSSSSPSSSSTSSTKRRMTVMDAPMPRSPNYLPPGVNTAAAAASAAKTKKRGGGGAGYSSFHRKREKKAEAGSEEDAEETYRGDVSMDDDEPARESRFERTGKGYAGGGGDTGVRSDTTGSYRMRVPPSSNGVRRIGGGGESLAATTAADVRGRRRREEAEERKEEEQRKRIAKAVEAARKEMKREFEEEKKMLMQTIEAKAESLAADKATLNPFPHPFIYHPSSYADTTTPVVVEKAVQQTKERLLEAANAEAKLEMATNLKALKKQLKAQLEKRVKEQFAKKLTKQVGGADIAQLDRYGLLIKLQETQHILEHEKSMMQHQHKQKIASLRNTILVREKENGQMNVKNKAVASSFTSVLTQVPSLAACCLLMVALKGRVAELEKRVSQLCAAAAQAKAASAASSAGTAESVPAPLSSSSSSASAAAAQQSSSTTTSEKRHHATTLPSKDKDGEEKGTPKAAVASSSSSPDLGVNLVRDFSRRVSRVLGTSFSPRDDSTVGSNYLSRDNSFSFEVKSSPKKYHIDFIETQVEKFHERLDRYGAILRNAHQVFRKARCGCGAIENEERIRAISGELFVENVGRVSSNRRADNGVQNAVGKGIAHEVAKINSDEERELNAISKHLEACRRAVKNCSKAQKAIEAAAAQQKGGGGGGRRRDSTTSTSWFSRVTTLEDEKKLRKLLVAHVENYERKIAASNEKRSTFHKLRVEACYKYQHVETEIAQKLLGAIQVFLVAQKDALTLMREQCLTLKEVVQSTSLPTYPKWEEVPLRREPVSYGLNVGLYDIKHGVYESLPMLAVFHTSISSQLDVQRQIVGEGGEGGEEAKKEKKKKKKKKKTEEEGLDKGEEEEDSEENKRGGGDKEDAAAAAAGGGGGGGESSAAEDDLDDDDADDDDKQAETSASSLPNQQQGHKEGEAEAEAEASDDADESSSSSSSSSINERMVAIPVALEMLSPFVEKCPDGAIFRAVNERIARGGGSTGGSALGNGESSSLQRRYGRSLSNVSEGSDSNTVVSSETTSIITQQNLQDVNNTVPAVTTFSRMVWLQLHAAKERREREQQQHGEGGEKGAGSDEGESHGDSHSGAVQKFKKSDDDESASAAFILSPPDGYTKEALERTQAHWKSLPLAVKVELYSHWTRSLEPTLLPPATQEALRDLFMGEAMKKAGGAGEEEEEDKKGEKKEEEQQRHNDLPSDTKEKQHDHGEEEAPADQMKNSRSSAITWQLLADHRLDATTLAVLRRFKTTGDNGDSDCGGGMARRVLEGDGIHRDDIVKYFRATLFTKSSGLKKCYRYTQPVNLATTLKVCHDGPGYMFKAREVLEEGEVVECIEIKDGWMRHAKGWSVMNYESAPVLTPCPNPVFEAECVAIEAMLLSP
eukprot:jgi/Bigna1/71328/fgenesh1_pg.15_\